MEGKAMIQLFNDGKEVKRVPWNHNFITNAYKRWQERINMWPTTFMSGAQFSSIQNLRPIDLCGGILLFDDVMPTDLDTYVPPLGNCVGHAGGSYAGANPYRGSFNSVESGAISTGQITTGWRWVWDFATNQGNGTIKSVCMTTQTGGDIGYKNDAVPTTLLSGFLTAMGWSATKLLKISPDYRTIYYQSGASGGNVSLKKIITQDLSNIGLLQSPKMIDDTSVAPFVSVPAGSNLSLEYVGNTLYGLLFTSSTLTLKTYNDSLVEQASLTLDNTGSHVFSQSILNWGMIGNTIYVIGNVGSQYVLHKWSKADGSYQGSVNVSSNYNNYNINTFDDNNIAMSNGNYVTLYNGTTFQGSWREFGDYGNIYTYKRISGTPLVLVSNNPYNSYAINVGYMGTAFFTVNNLATPVPKTNANTMKVTYDITW